MGDAEGKKAAQNGASEKREVAVYETYKDRLFRMVFREKKELLSLYNAVNGTDYTDANDLEVVTLENAIYMNMKNDLAFVMGFYLNLYEHQSTFNPNMPLRDLFYIAKELEGLIDHKRMYGSTLVRIPTPRFVVFYNGTAEQPDRQVLRLSDAFEIPEEEPQLELLVTMLNINLGRNRELASRCRTLEDYMIYIARVREYVKMMELSAAVEKTVQECIAEGVLEEFLTRYRKEVIAMSIFEYNEEEVMQYLREEAIEQGLAEGLERGLEQGLERGMEEGCAKGTERVNHLNQKLAEQKRTDDIIKAASDKEYQQKLFEEFGL